MVRLLPFLAVLLVACQPPAVALDDTGWLEDTGDADTDVDSDTDADTDTDTDDEDWHIFLDARQGYLEQLAVPILDCVVRTDTSHPAFHGCIDWHSAVHATWALHTISALTGDDSYRQVADSTLDPASLEGELQQLQSGSIARTELPYGYAWFLALSRAREDAGEADLTPLAAVVFDELLDHMWGLDADSISNYLQDDDYQNLSWEALNLHQRAAHLGDDAMAEVIEDWVRAELVPRAELCPLEASPGNRSDFFPPCLHLALVVLTVLPEEDAEAWLDANLPEGLDLEPLVTMGSAHQGGLNFSRSWGLWALWQATGDRHYRDLYREHIETHMAMPEYWAQDYYSFAHWVPQFGVYGIAASYP